MQYVLLVRLSIYIQTHEHYTFTLFIFQAGRILTGGAACSMPI